jgi:hypothetical protein
MTRATTDVPEPLEFLEALGAEPIESRPEDGYWCYEFSDNRGVVLRISFDAIERSVQTLLRLDDEVLTVCSHEGVTRIWLQEEKGRKTIRAACRYGPADGELVALVTPVIHVGWSVLIKRE